MKKTISKIIFIALIVSLIFGGKYVIDKKTYNYKEPVNDNLTNYFINNDVQALDNIVTLLNEHNDDEEFKEGVQNYTADIVGSWFVYTDKKYYCSSANKNSCIAQFNELKKLAEKLEVIYKYKTKDGSSIIVPSTYNSLSKQVQTKTNAIQKSINISTSRDPLDIEQIRLKKCQSTNECDNCREGGCKCIYTDYSSKIREEIMCWGKNIEQ